MLDLRENEDKRGTIERLVCQPVLCWGRQPVQALQAQPLAPIYAAVQRIYAGQRCQADPAAFSGARQAP